MQWGRNFNQQPSASRTPERAGTAACWLMRGRSGWRHSPRLSYFSSSGAEPAKPCSAASSYIEGHLARRAGDRLPGGAFLPRGRCQSVAWQALYLSKDVHGVPGRHLSRERWLHNAGVVEPGLAGQQCCGTLLCGIRRLFRGPRLLASQPLGIGMQISGPAVSSEALVPDLSLWLD